MTLKHLIALSILLAPLPALADNVVRNEHTTLSLIAEKTSITKDESEGFRVGVLIEAHDGWHTYWENPGDAGLATTLTWSLPENFNASPIDWPAPTRLNEGPLAIYAYEGTILLPVTITPPTTFAQPQTPLKVHVDLLVCKDICVPESADLELTLPVSSQAATNSKHANLFQHPNATHVLIVTKPASFAYTEKTLTLTIPLTSLVTTPAAKAPALKDIRSAQFFPREMNIIQYATDQNLSGDAQSLTLTIARAENGETPEKISGILTLDIGSKSQSYNLSFNPKTITTQSTTQPSTIVFSTAIFLAIIGGLILNLMPCVLPVLSLKALALAKKSGHAHSAVIRQGVAYTLGIAASFAAISGLLIALRTGGEAVGWGYQMQSPAFVGALIYLLFLVGLSLSGVFHLPVLLGGVGNEAASESSAKGSFLTGILATAVATPCTAPFMAPAIGAALTMPAWQSLLVFQALGFGLALPYLLICLFPALRTFLPKPGAWMETFKELMAFPMYASVIWLMWVLTLQTGVSGMVTALIAMLLLVILIWISRFFEQGSRTYLIVVTLLATLTAATSLHTLSTLETDSLMQQPPAAHEIQTLPYSKEALTKLRAEGKPVYVDATAAWCITCQVNASVAIHTPRTMAAFAEYGVTLMIADWTRRNDKITEFLAGFDFNGVPLNVFYPANNAEPIILPQILSEDIVIQTITQKGH